VNAPETVPETSGNTAPIVAFLPAAGAECADVTIINPDLACPIPKIYPPREAATGSFRTGIEHALVCGRLVDRRTDGLASAGIPRARARQIIERQCEGILLPSLVLPFDDQSLTGKTVADVLADPATFEGATLADPNEGRAYGLCKAKIMRRVDGSPWIHSFAHGRTIYELRYDADAVEKAVVAADKDMAARLFTSLAVAADLDEIEIERLKGIACEQAKIGKRALNADLKSARAAHNKQRAAGAPRALTIQIPHRIRSPIHEAHTIAGAHHAAAHAARRVLDGTPHRQCRSCHGSRVR
jgi:hypothetical protein